MSEREQLLVALGAALGSNCVPCVEKIVPKGRAAGIEDATLRSAVRIADSVRQKPARAVLETAQGLLGGEIAPDAGEAGCPIEAPDEPFEDRSGHPTWRGWACCS